MNEPKIRIKGFKGEWKKKPFSSLFSIISDYQSNIANKADYRDRGKYPIIDQSKSFIIGYTDLPYPIHPSNGGFIIFGDHTRELKFVNFPFYTGADGTRILKSNDSYISQFLYYSCCSKRIPNTGYNRHFKYLKEATFKIPSLSEQSAIATYFRHLDELIETVEKKVASLKQVKEASLQSMFPQEGQTVPKVRFKGFVGEWEISKLKEISQKVIDKNIKLQYKTTLTNSAEYGIIDQLDFFDNKISNGENIRNYYIVKDKDFVYNPRISTTAPVGPINQNLLGFAGVMSPLYYVFRITNKGIDDCYLRYFFKTNIWHKFMKDNGNSGARFDRLSITDNVFEQMPIIHPVDLDEQRKIASFFINLDKEIGIQQHRLTLLKRIKSACLDEMFV